jgi:hypothetical protein
LKARGKRAALISPRALEASARRHNLLNWRPKSKLREGLAATIDYFRALAAERQA